MNFNLINFCEINKDAIKSYCAVHGVNENKNLGDIAKIDITSLPVGIDLIVSGSPCTSYSIAGKQEGGAKGSGTPSSLLWNSVDVIKHCKPKFVIWENVKNVLSNKHFPVFKDYIIEMKRNGYNTYYRVLNAKDYGVPQNGQRIYAISVREDIDNNLDYDINNMNTEYYDRNCGSLYPKPQSVTIKLKDFLEQSVNEKYYLDDSYVKKFNLNNIKCAEFEPIELKQLYHVNKTNAQGNRVYDINGLAGTLVATNGGLGAKTRLYQTEEGRIRKLTPKECWRLMGFDDIDFEKAYAIGNTDNKLYIQAGNSIVVNVLEGIYRCLHATYPNDFKTNMSVISLFSGIGAFEKALERINF